MVKKLKVEEPVADPELESLLDKMKTQAIEEATPVKAVISSRQKEHLDAIRQKGIAKKKENKEKLAFLEKYYTENEKKKVNQQENKRIYAARKAREEARKHGKTIQPVDESYDEEPDQGFDEEIDDPEPSPPPTPVRQQQKKTPNTTVPVKKIPRQTKPPQQRQPQTNNPFAGILG